MRHYIALSLAVTLFTVPWFAVNYPDQTNSIVATLQDIGGQVAAVITHNPRTIAQLQQTYNQASPKAARKVRILLVPGHEPTYRGAEYGALKEREMTVELANDLAQFLSVNPKYEVMVTRDTNSWNPTLEAYFKHSWDQIISWQKDHRQEALRSVLKTPQPTPKVYHNSAPDDVAYRLYGITKWSNENAIDIALHIHFNDYPGHPWKVPGEYTGFSIYTPEAQYANSTTTRALAETVFRRLQKYNPVSDFPGESDGIVAERELIAVGANNTADAASMLIEYGYLYEQQFTDSHARELALKDLAFQTYLGLEDFFNPKNPSVAASAYDTLLLPHTWKGPIADDSQAIGEIYALQTALLVDGVYPPGAKSMNDCPRTGKIGPCTKTAVQSFQKKYGISEKGVGEKTILQLNKKYSGVL